MLINNFDVWKMLKITHTPGDSMVTCPVCSGEGYISDECEYCGNESEHLCGLCEGYRNLRFDDVPNDKIDILFSKAVYHSEVIADLEKLATWEGKNRIGFLLENGYSVYTLVTNKNEKVSPVPVIGI